MFRKTDDWTIDSRSGAWGTAEWPMGGSGWDEREGSPRTDIIGPCKVQDGCGEGEGG